jgi:hypothetical protein
MTDADSSVMHAMMQSLISAESEGTVQKASLGKIATSNFDIELPVSHVPNHYEIRKETINLKSKKGKEPAERGFFHTPHPAQGVSIARQDLLLK